MNRHSSLCRSDNGQTRWVKHGMHSIVYGREGNLSRLLHYVRTIFTDLQGRIAFNFTATASLAFNFRTTASLARLVTEGETQRKAHSKDLIDRSDGVVVDWPSICGHAVRVLRQLLT